MAPLPLKWAHEPPERLQVAVDPDVPRRLDFISNEEFLGGRAIIMTPDHALRGMATQLTAGTYRLTVRARGAEAAPVDGVFEVFVGGTWNDISVRDAP